MVKTRSKNGHKLLGCDECWNSFNDTEDSCEGLFDHRRVLSILDEGQAGFHNRLDRRDDTRMQVSSVYALALSIASRSKMPTHMTSSRSERAEIVREVSVNFPTTSTNLGTT